jgi:hypothetical protein
MMHAPLARLTILAGFVLSLVVGSSVADGNDRQPFADFFGEHCVSCHSGSEPQGGLDLETLGKQLNDPRTFARYVAIHDRVERGEMPPEGESPIEEPAKRAFLEKLAGGLSKHEATVEGRSGRTPLRRLNRYEYENTVRELLAVEVSVREILPPDTPAHGFDTVADNLRFSQLQLEKYLEAADHALEAAIDLTAAPQRFNAKLSLKDEDGIRDNLDTPEGTIRDPVSMEKHRVVFGELPDAVILFADGYPSGDFRKFSATEAGTYRFRASASAYRAGGKSAILRIFAHRFQARRLLDYFSIPEQGRVVEFTAHLNRDELVQVAPYGIGFDDEGQTVWNTGAAAFKGSGLALQWLEIEGPLETWPRASLATLYPDIAVESIAENERPWHNHRQIGYRLAPKDPSEDARRVVEHFASRAFRRSVSADEAAPFVKLAVDALLEGLRFEDATRRAFRAVLTAPQFLFLDAQPGKLDDAALASRLAYFLWSGPPDEVLRAVADEGKLSDPKTLREQTERMLSDERSQQFIRNFTGQWLDLRNIRATSPDMQLYPEFDEMLAHSMVVESEAFFAELLAKNESTDNLIDSDFLMINQTMARHYGIEADLDERFQRVPVPKGSPRGGVLTQAAVLKVTANGTVTSPVLRGTWVMKRLLGQPPQPPPPNVGAVEPDTRGTSTIRQLLDKHRRSETCASCHQQIDPPGFALESFDVIGGYRERYRSLGEGEKPTWKLAGREIWEYKLGLAVDASGELPGGKSFRGIDDFKQLLMTNSSKQVLRNVVERLMVYSTGAGIRFSDRAEVSRIVARLAAEGSGLRSAVHEVVQSPLFQSK